MFRWLFRGSAFVIVSYWLYLLCESLQVLDQGVWVLVLVETWSLICDTRAWVCVSGVVSYLDWLDRLRWCPS